MGERERKRVGDGEMGRWDGMGSGDGMGALRDAKKQKRRKVRVVGLAPWTCVVGSRRGLAS